MTYVRTAGSFVVHASRAVHGPAACGQVEPPTEWEEAVRPTGEGVLRLCTRCASRVNRAKGDES